jgi:hypothetical protein
MLNESITSNLDISYNVRYNRGNYPSGYVSLYSRMHCIFFVGTRHVGGPESREIYELQAGKHALATKYE